MASAVAVGLANIDASSVMGVTPSVSKTNPGMDEIWRKYFGDPDHQWMSNSYPEISHDSYDLPEAYVGRNVHITTVIKGLILEKERQIGTDILLPVFETNEHHWTMNKFEFKRALVGRVPHRGVPRVQSFSKSSRGVSTERYGTAMYLERDFWKTPEGQEMYAMSLTGMGVNARNTINLDVFFTLMTCKTFESHWRQTYTTLPTSYEKLVDYEVKRFACVPSNDKSFDVALIEEVGVLDRTKVTKESDGRYALIVPPKFKVNMSTGGGPSRTDYYLAGPEGTRKANKGPDSIGTLANGKVEVYELPPNDIQSSFWDLSVLSRRTDTGERYDNFYERRNSNLSVEGYFSKERDILVWDRNESNWVKVLFSDQIKHLGIYGDNYKYHPVVSDTIAHANDNGVQAPSRIPNDDKAFDGDSDDEDKDNGNVMSQKDPKTFFILAARNEDGTQGLSEYWLEVVLKSMSAKDQQQVGESIAYSAFKGDIPYELFKDYISIIKDIDGTGYDEDFAVRLKEANDARSLGTDGSFKGQKTPSAMVKEWNTIQISEWTPNKFGGWDLPAMPEGSEIAFPFGYHNIPGLRTIAEHAVKTNSHWHQLGLRAKRILDALERWAEFSSKACPSDAFNPMHQAPWFHKPDPLQAFHGIYFRNRPPIFSPHLPSKKMDGVVQGVKDTSDKDGKKNKSNENEIPVRPHRVFVVDPKQTSKGDIDRIFKGDKSVELVPNIDDSTVSIVTLSSGTINIPTELVKNGRLIPTELKLRLLMGKRSTESLNSLIDLLGRDAAGAASKEKLIKYLFLFAVANKEDKNLARKLVIALLVDVDKNKAKLVDTINTLSLVTTGKASATKKTESQKMVNKLLEFNPQFVDEDIGITPGLDLNTADTLLNINDSDKIANVSYADFSGTFDDVLKLRAEIDIIRPSDAPFDYSGGVGTGWFTNGVGTGNQELDSRMVKIIALINKLAAYLTSLATSGVISNVEQEVDARVKKAIEKVPYKLSGAPELTVAAQWYRCPLSMSFELLRTSYNLDFPLIRAGDPSTGYTSAWIPQGGDTTVPDDVYRMPEYASVESIFSGNQDEREHIVQTPFVQKEISYSIGSKNINDGFEQQQQEKVRGEKRERTSNSNSRTMSLDEYLDENDEDMSPYDRASRKKYISEDYSSGKGTMNISSHGRRPRREETHYVEPKGGWTHEELTRPSQMDTDENRFDRSRLFGSVAELSQRYKKFTGEVPVYRFKKAMDIEEPVVRMSTIVFLLSKCEDGRNIIKMVENNVHVPINISLQRPFISEIMDSAILMVAGRDTGFTAFGNADFQLGQDVAAKMIIGTFTYKYKAIVSREDNVRHLFDIMPVRYCGGYNTKFITSAKDIQQLGQDNRDRKSMIAIAFAITEKKPRRVFSLTSKFPVVNANSAIDRLNKSNYYMREFYEQFYRFSKFASNTPYGQEYFDEKTSGLNMVTLPGAYIKYNVVDKRFKDAVNSQSHVKNQGVGPGSSQTWDGEVGFFPPAFQTSLDFA